MIKSNTELVIEGLGILICFAAFVIGVISLQGATEVVPAIKSATLVLASTIALFGR